MSPAKLLACSALVLALAAGLFLLGRGSAQLAAVSPHDTTAPAKTPTTSDIQSMRSGSPTRAPHSVPLAPPPPGDLANLMDMSDLRSPDALRHTLREMSQRSDADVADAIASLYRSAARGDFARRERALWFAAKRNSVELLPLWQDVLRRTTPVFDDEDDLLRNSLSLPHDERARALRVERSAAIGGVGGLQAASTEAVTFLREIALHKSKTVPHLDAALRMDAVRALHAADRLVLLKLARELPTEDPLTERLATLATQERARRGAP